MNKKKKRKPYKPREKAYKLCDLKLVILAKMTRIIPPTIISYGKYEYKSMKGAYFAEPVHKTSTTTVYKRVTKEVYYNDTPEENLFKGATFVYKTYDADVALAYPIEKTGMAKLKVSQLQALEQAFKEKGFVSFNSESGEQNQ